MGITPDDIAFPQNVAATLAVALATIDPRVKVYRRPLRTTDESLSISVIPVDWQPDEGSRELRRPPEPTIQRYSIVVQAMVRDMEEERGVRMHSVLSANVRHMLHRDPDLQIALPLHTAVFGNTRESMGRWGVSGQQFMNNDGPKGGFAYLSTLDFWFETQISPI